jgi:hypothetical protein
MKSVEPGEYTNGETPFGFIYVTIGESAYVLPPYVKVKSNCKLFM